VTGRRLGPDDYSLRPSRVVMAQVLPPDAALDVQLGTARVALSHPESVGGLDCDDASCELDGNDLVIRGLKGADETLDVRLHLRPHLYLLRGTVLDPSPTLSIPIQRCPVAIASAAPFRGLPEQNLVVRLGGRCGHDSALRFATAAGPATVLRTQAIGDVAYAVVHVGRVEGDELYLTVERAGTVVGHAHAGTRHLPTSRALLELPGYGAIDFIPTNRDALVKVHAGDEGAEVVPLAIEGVYTISHHADGDHIRGLEGTAGTVALRMAYRDRALPAPLRDVDLAEVEELVDRQLRVANIPVHLGASVRSSAPLVELECGDGLGHQHRIEVTVTASLPYRARDSCQLVLHRERLSPEDGVQALNLSVNVSASDGTPRAEARIDQRLLLRRADQPRYLNISGVTAPFDRVTVRASIAADDIHYVIAPEENLGAQAQWAVVMGNSRARIFATTAIPTGLYRVDLSGDDTIRKNHSGILALNAGALLRLTWLTREGQEGPIGLEAGVIWLGIAGEQGTSVTTLGQVAIVTGVGVGIPIANQSRLGQTSINLHLWFDYEPQRGLTADAGSAFGVVFGPSLTIGDLGTNF
jgi:hypothetical protein